MLGGITSPKMMTMKILQSRISTHSAIAVTTMIPKPVFTITIEAPFFNEAISITSVAGNLLQNYLITWPGNWVGAKFIPTNPGWFQPKRFLSVFTRTYGQRLLGQTAIGCGGPVILNIMETVHKYINTNENGKIFRPQFLERCFTND